MKTVKLGGITVGEDKPKICVPIVAKSEEEALLQATYINDSVADIVELRIDYFDFCHNIDKVLEFIHQIRKLINKPLLFTFRSAREGGESGTNRDEYRELLNSVINTGIIDAVDIELYSGGGDNENEVVDEKYLQDIILQAHKRGVIVVMSNHDFEKTPVDIEIIGRLVKMQSLDADIAKIAVMPNTKEDLFTLIESTNEAIKQYMEIPVVTMSMGKIGMLSRIAGEIFGSSITFGTIGNASAPGQIPVDDLKQILDIIHKNN